MNKLLLLIFLLSPLTALSNDELPKKLIFAVQPHDARFYESTDHINNIVFNLARELNVKVELYECPWARCMQAIKSGKADIIDDLFYSQVRSTFVKFLKPSFETQTAGFRFFADNSRTPLVKNWDDLTPLRIGTLRGYAHFPKFDNANNLQKIDFLSIEKIAELIIKGRLDTFIAPPSFDATSFETIDTQRKITQQPYAYNESIPLFLGISKKSVWMQHQEILTSTLKQLVKNNK